MPCDKAAVDHAWRRPLLSNDSANSVRIPWRPIERVLASTGMGAGETGFTKVGELFDVSDVLTHAALSGALRAAIHPFEVPGLVEQDQPARVARHVGGLREGEPARDARRMGEGRRVQRSELRAHARAQGVAI